MPQLLNDHDVYKHMSFKSCLPPDIVSLQGGSEKKMKEGGRYGKRANQGLKAVTNENVFCKKYIYDVKIINKGYFRM